MNKLSPQKQYILSFLRSGKWVCGSSWLNKVKDDRRRLIDLAPYMASKGFKIDGEACKGRSCGNTRCPLFRRKAVKIEANNAVSTGYSETEVAEIQKHAYALWDAA